MQTTLDTPMTTAPADGFASPVLVDEELAPWRGKR
jgi:hypothetical protein